MIQEVIFDLETQKLFSNTGVFDPEKLAVSIASVYVRQVTETQEEISGKLISFWEQQKRDQTLNSPKV